MYLMFFNLAPHRGQR